MKLFSKNRIFRLLVLVFLSFILQICLSYSAQLPAPTLITPGLNYEPGSAIITITPTLAWNRVPGATRYGLYISKQPYGEANQIYFNENINLTVVPTPEGYLKNGVKYRWKVAAFDSNGQIGIISQPLHFQISLPQQPVSTPVTPSYNVGQQQPTPTSTTQIVGSQPLPVPALAFPGSASESGSTILTITPTLAWNNVPGATRYGVYVSKQPYGEANQVYFNENIYGTSIFLREGYLSNGLKYRWKVTAFDGNGQIGIISQPLYFKVSLPQQPVSTPVMPSYNVGQQKPTPTSTTQIPTTNITRNEAAVIALQLMEADEAYIKDHKRTDLSGRGLTEYSEWDKDLNDCITLCQVFVNTVYNVPRWVETAKGAADVLISNADRDPLNGAIVFYTFRIGGIDYGHAGIYVDTEYNGERYKGVVSVLSKEKGAQITTGLYIGNTTYRGWGMFPSALNLKIGPSVSSGSQNAGSTSPTTTKPGDEIGKTVGNALIQLLDQLFKK